MALLLDADHLVFGSEYEDDLIMVVGRFVEVCTRNGLKINSDNNRVMVLGREEGSICEVFVGGTRLEHVSEFR